MINKNCFKHAIVNDKVIVVGGIGEMYYQDGFPISMTIEMLKEQGIGFSALHIADELYKNGWTKKRILNTLSQEIEGCEKEVSDFIDLATSGDRKEELPPNGQEWIYSENGYELQREALFNSLFGFSSKEAIEDLAKRNLLQPTVDLAIIESTLN